MNKEELIQTMNTFEDARKKLMEEFGASETWQVIYPENQLGLYWFIHDEEICWSRKPFLKGTIDGMNLYKAAVYMNWEWKKNKMPPWRKDGLAMIPVDTNTDGNKFLMIFDEDLECKDEELIDLYLEY